MAESSTDAKPATARQHAPGGSGATSEKPSNGFRSIGQEAAITLLRSADAVRHHFAEVLRPWGVTLQQYNVLRILRGAGPEGLPAMRVKQRLMEKTPGVTRLLDHLATRGLITRERCPDDRRVVHNRITKAGLELMAELDVPIDQADEDAVAALSRSQQGELVRLLSKLLDRE